MLALFGKWHTVCSGYCVLSSGRRFCGSLKSRLKLKAISNKVLEEYISSQQWKGKAGGYNITDPEFGCFVEGVEGSKLNIVGMPVEKLLPVIEAVSRQKAGRAIVDVEAELFKGEL